LPYLTVNLASPVVVGSDDSSTRLMMRNRVSGNGGGRNDDRLRSLVRTIRGHALAFDVALVTVDAKASTKSGLPSAGARRCRHPRARHQHLPEPWAGVISDSVQVFPAWTVGVDRIAPTPLVEPDPIARRL
jgi:hypothetical protein